MSLPIVIIGAGPAGLTAAYELLKAGRQNVTVLEASGDMGGISKTIEHNGNRIDIGGHRFFSKSDWVMNWWRDVLPVALPEGATSDASFRLAYQGASRLMGAATASACGGDRNVMLIRNRMSRIYFGGQFFDYPLKPNFETAMKLGAGTCAKFGVSYAASRLSPIKPELTLEDFFINRFGNQLYQRFFKEYTEKVWGVPCHDISAEWGAQRIKSLSIGSALKHAFKKMMNASGTSEQTSLIENFLYPKYGPGQMWEAVAQRVEKAGGRIIRHARVTRIDRKDDMVSSVTCVNELTNTEQQFSAGHVLSTMPIKDLVKAITPAPLEEVASIGAQLQYRDFITIGVLYRKLERTKSAINSQTNLVPDNWIYIQEPGVKVGRLQIFNNWSPYMVNDQNTVWVGMEFFAKDDDELWCMSDDALKTLALREMEMLRLARQDDALDCVVIRVPKAYPGYYGAAYDRLDEVKSYLDGLKNLFLIGRNGMHRYNNQDHSMLSAKYAVEAIIAGSCDKSKIWGVNVDDDYHEEDVDGGVND
ncbi:MAG: NAD(P)/FAD-dependent oxidoreductase [Pseudomonadota bacterium]